MTKELELKNAKIIWQRLKDEFEDEEYTNCYFYKDYLKNEKDFKYFFSELKEKEQWLDLSKEIDDDDYDQVLDHIENAIFESGVIFNRVKNFLGR